MRVASYLLESHLIILENDPELKQKEAERQTDRQSSRQTHVDRQIARQTYAQAIKPTHRQMLSDKKTNE